MLTDAELMAGADFVERDSRDDPPEVRRAKILSAMMSIRGAAAGVAATSSFVDGPKGTVEGQIARAILGEKAGKP